MWLKSKTVACFWNLISSRWSTEPSIYQMLWIVQPGLSQQQVLLTHGRQHTPLMSTNIDNTGHTELQHTCLMSNNIDNTRHTDYNTPVSGPPTLRTLVTRSYSTPVSCPLTLTTLVTRSYNTPVSCLPALKTLVTRTKTTVSRPPTLTMFVTLNAVAATISYLVLAVQRMHQISLTHDLCIRSQNLSHKVGVLL